MNKKGMIAFGGVLAAFICGDMVYADVIIPGKELQNNQNYSSKSENQGISNSSGSSVLLYSLLIVGILIFSIVCVWLMKKKKTKNSFIGEGSDENLENNRKL